MVSSKATLDFIKDLVSEFEDDDVASIFLGAAVIYYAKDILKRDPDHIYEGYIKGEEWFRVANRILEKKALTFSQSRPFPK